LCREMTQINYMTLVVFFAIGVICECFVSPPDRRDVFSQPQTSSTELYIIGPFIRKMRKNNAEKNKPMVTQDEKEGESPGLRVGGTAWTWPPIWPYDKEVFMRKEEIPKAPKNPSPLGGLMGDMAGSTEDLPKAEEEEVEILDEMKYWGEVKSSETTSVDEVAIEQLTKHYDFYLRDGMDILEFGAADSSYLPEGLKVNRHVGAGASTDLMKKNPALSEVITVNLNDVVEEEGIRSEELRALGTKSFDVIIMANTIDFLTSPLEVYRSAWQLLKPDGLMIVPFVNKDAYSNQYERAQTKMWRDYNDDQHMWIAGSFFRFSAGEGWKDLKGFDISPENAKKIDGNFLSKLRPSSDMNMFVCQATKAEVDVVVDESDPEKSFSSKMWVLPILEDRDKKLLAPRLSRSYTQLKDNEDMEAVANNVELLPKIYESLTKMDSFSFGFSLQSQLAADLVSDKNFNGNEDQILALKMGLGLRTPSKEFWEPVGQLTSSIVAEDKVNLLAHIVPRFGSGDPEQEAALEAFVSGLDPTFNVIRSKCSDMPEEDVQLIGGEMLASEILNPGRSSKKEFAIWLGSLTVSEIEEYMKKRKSYRETALSDKKTFQKNRKEVEERQEALKEKYLEQRQKAREERSMIFNSQTGKFEAYKKD